MNYIKRPHYLDFLRRHRDRQIIKVVSGVRRAGKSVLFQLYKEELLATGVDEDQIISINFEDLSYYDLRDFQTLFAYIKERLVEEKTYYIFLALSSNFISFPTPLVPTKFAISKSACFSFCWRFRRLRFSSQT